MAQSVPDSSVGKESSCNAGNPGSIPGSGRSAGEGKGYPLQYSGLENSMDCVGHGVAESDTTEQLSLSLPLVPLRKPYCFLDIFKRCPTEMLTAPSFLSVIRASP